MSPFVVCKKSPASTGPEAVKSGVVVFVVVPVLVIVKLAGSGLLVDDSGIAKIRYQGRFDTFPEFPFGSMENPVVGTPIVSDPRPVPVVQVAVEAPVVGQNPTFGSIIWPKAETHTKLARISNARILAYLIVPPPCLIA
jgi:hypothetical protein